MAFTDVISALNPVGWWRLGEADKADPFQDETANNNDGTHDGGRFTFFVPGPGAINGDPDTAADFSDSLLMFGAPPALANLPAADFSFLFFIGDNHTGFDLGRALASNRDASTGWVVEVRGAETLRYLHFEISLGGANVVVDTVAGSVTSHPTDYDTALITYNFASKTAKIYIDGAEAGYTTNTSGSGSYVAETAANEFFLGYDAIGAGYQLYARLDEPALFASELSAANASDIHAAATGIDPGASAISASIEQHIYAVNAISVDIRQQIVLAFGSVSALIEQDIFKVTGSISVDIRQQIVSAFGSAGVLIEQSIIEYGTVTAAIAQEITLSKGAPTAIIEQQLFGASTVAATIEQQLVDTANQLPWSLVVTLNGTDVSASLTGLASIDAEEGAAMVADFTLRPAAGPVALSDWAGAAVTIDYAELSGGSVLWQQRLFTGIVDVPVYDPVSRLTTFKCTDNLQGRMDAMERPTIDGIVGGFWSEHVFPPDAQGWDYAQDRLQTLSASYDINPDGSGQLTPWLAKVVPDEVLTEGDIYDESLRVTLASRRGLINDIDVELDYRFTRYRQRERRVKWDYSRSFIDYLVKSTSLPNKQMILAAAASSGWQIMPDPSWVLLPPSGLFYISGDPIAWVISDTLRDQLVRGVDVWLAKRFEQTITEQYRLRVYANQSVQLLGSIPRSERHNLTAEDDRDWEAVEGYSAPPSSVDANGDYFEDGVLDPANDRASMQNMLQTVVSISRAEILNSHRQNWVAVACPIKPHLNRSQTMEVSTATVQARGKVRQYVHSFNIDTAAAASTITLAVSKAQSAGGLGDDSTAAPSPPDTSVTGPAIETNVLETWLGGASSSPVFNEDWRGFVGGFSPAYVGSQVYDDQFVMSSTEIDAPSRDELIAIQSGDVHVDIPDELLQQVA